ncbi:Transposon tx1 uncharacterized protein [Thalictrum thalictroides]|uniref:Transposon tx1 uncharacterized protein n=1 Tax=Thalictrum thalictroides TaxID=46969 RepID=A0A7J6X4B2_THATH|nr:Transposon tx1 uncharacterized protein [Thalictrum thalictroides]
MVTPFTEDEVLNAINEFQGEKAPGPDGFQMVVFQKCWSIFKHDIMKVMCEFYEDEFIYWRNNTTFIFLIPKKLSAASLNDFRPKSLVGGIYKIFSKVLSTRLMVVLPSLISPEQCAFVGNRQILDGVLIANECIESRLRAKQDRLICKVDIAKAYD